MLPILTVLWAALCMQTPDTLVAAMLSAPRDLPTLKPAEEIKVNESEASVAAGLSEAVKRFTGVQVKDYGGLGGLKTINVRSLGSEHVGVFLDGVQMDNAQNMQVDLGRLSLEGLSDISLYNAQKNVRLQSAKEYASGQALHLVSSAPRSDALQLRVRGGSFGTFNPSIVWDKCLGRIGLRASAGFVGSRGNYKYPYFDTTLVRENGDIKSLRLEARVCGTLDKGSWDVHLYGYGSERGFPGPVIRRASGFPFSAERQADRDLFAQMSWIQDWSEHWSTAIRAKYSNNYTHYATHPEKNPMAMPYDLHYLQQSAYISAVQSYAVDYKWSFDLAADLQWNGLRSDAFLSRNPRRLCFTGALAARYKAESLRFGAHLAYQGARDGGEGEPLRAWMPSLSIAWEPLEWMELDAFAKRSYRLPSFNDLYYSLMGNSSLKPESAFQSGLDLFIHANSGSWRWEGRVSPYYNRVSDKIVAIPTVSQFSWTMLNIGLADIAGLDLKACATLTKNNFSASLTLRYSYQSALDHSVPESLTYGNQLPYIPRHSASSDLLLKWRAWTLSWNTLYNGERWSRSANIADYHIAPWSVSDAQLSRSFELNALGRKISAAASLLVSNVFSFRYEIVQGYPMPGRSILASVSFQI